MSEEKTFEDIAAEKQAEEKEPKLLQRPTVLVLALALVIILGAGLILPLKDSLTLNGWLKKANAEAQALYAEIPEGLSFSSAEYDGADRTLVLYDFFVNESDPIPARTEVGRVALPEGAGLKTFRDARSLKGGVLFARKLTSGTLVPDWEGLYINESGEIGGLEDYVLREVGENAWYLGSVPQGLE